MTTGGANIRQSGPGSANALVTGTGSVWNTGALDIRAADLSQPQLLVTSGARVNSTGTDMTRGLVEVSGTGSVWNSGDLVLGDISTLSSVLASVVVADGATLQSGTALVGRLGSILGGASVVVTGAGSTWNLSGNLSIAPVDGSQGVVVVTDGAVVNVAGGTGTVSVGGPSNFAYLSIGEGLGGPGPLPAPGVLNAANVVLGDAGWLVFSHNASNYVFAPTVSGTGELKHFGGTTILTATNTHSGGTTIEGGTLQLGNGGTVGSIVGDVVNRGTLVFNRSNALIFGGAISDTGDVEQNGDGTTTLTGINTYTGTTTVNAGTLLVNGSIAPSAVTINNGGTLGGTGTVGSTTVAAGGTLAPGASIGTLSVAGDISFTAGTTYEVEANAAGASDLIDATGTATIDGGTVEVIAAPGSYQPSTTYTILAADGGVTGTFDGVTSNFAFLTPTLAYDADNVFLTLERNGIDFGDIGGTFNQRSTGGAVEPLGTGNPIFDAVVVLDVPAARNAFDQLSGEIHASAKGMLADDSRFVRDAALERLRTGFEAAAEVPVLAYGPGDQGAAPADVRRFAVWGQGFGAWSSFDSDGNAAAFERSAGGVLLGADALGGETWRVGLLGGFSRSSFDVEDRASSGDGDSYHLGIYGGVDLGALRLSRGAAHSWHDIETVRTVAFQGFDDMLSASYDAGTTQIFGEAGYAVEAGQFSLEPFAGLAHASVRTDAFVETGDAAALTSAASSTDVTFSTLGVRASADFALGDIGATTRGMIGWRHAFGDVTPLSSFAFAGGDAFTIAGVPIAEDAVVLELGLDLGLAPNAMLGIAYSGQIAGNAGDHAAQAKFSLAF